MNRERVAPCREVEITARFEKLWLLLKFYFHINFKQFDEIKSIESEQTKMLYFI